MFPFGGSPGSPFVLALQVLVFLWVEFSLLSRSRVWKSQHQIRGRQGSEGPTCDTSVSVSLGEVMGGARVVGSA